MTEYRCLPFARQPLGCLHSPQEQQPMVSDYSSVIGRQSRGARQTAAVERGVGEEKKNDKLKERGRRWPGGGGGGGGV